MEGYIYKIVNKITKEFYVGSTLYPNKRKKQHFNDLKHEKHHSIYLQRAYNKYGIENFEFIIVKKVNIETEIDLRNLEERYIKFCWNSGKLYNVSKVGCGGDNLTYHPMLTEIREKQKKSIKQRWDSKTDKEKEEYSKKMKGRGNPNFGNKWTEEQKQKASNYWKNYYLTHDSNLKGKTFIERFGEEKAKEIKEKISKSSPQRSKEKNPFYGKHHTNEAKEKIGKARKGVTPSDAKKVLYNGVIYTSATECSKKTGINYLTICYRCRKQIYGFSYVDETSNPKEAKERFNLEKCIEIAKTCKTKKEFENKNASAYQWVLKNGYMGEISNKYFVELRHRWTYEEVEQLAKKYSSYSEFWKVEKKAVSIMNQHKWIEQIKNIWFTKIMA